MKNLRICILLIFASLTFNTYSQDLIGIIKYRAVINEKYVDSFLIALNHKDISPLVKEQVTDLYKNATPDEFILIFNNDESYYRHTPILEDNFENNLGSKAGKIDYYTNNSIDKIIENNPSFGNISHKPLNWEITNEAKMIDGYFCKMATTKEKLYSRKGYFYDKKIVVWFAPEISFKFGPKNYSGLPGLVLEVYNDVFTMTAIDINLNVRQKYIKIDNFSSKGSVKTMEEAYPVNK